MAIVTISRASGLGGEEIARSVARKLGYEFLNKDLIFKEVEGRGEQWLKWGEDLDEHCPTLWDRFDQSFSGFVALVESCLYEYALKDKVVILGRGGNWLLKDIPFVLRVRITAPLEARIKLTSDREGIDTKHARRLIAASEHERSCYLQSIFHKDWSDPAAYDVVYNMDSLSLNEMTDLIIEEMPAKDKKATPEAIKELGQLALAAKVKAAIFTDYRIFIPTLEVFHDGSGIVIRGIVHPPEEMVKVMEVARRAAGFAPIKSELHYRGA